ncbi:hypothetical protein QI003_16630 [Bacillus stercoris]|nr:MULTISPECIES: hypothetical protein [Bacillus]AFI29209.1 hypothetical protein MY9_2676 [Bacillus sp. JS]MDN0189780.1 hypothetical protein [Bacillus sp. B.PNR1]MDN3034174.1 hypothetical protein [Bacillus sp. B.PNR2]WGV94129.1 hypothetical protein QI003_16630 [Bacillus stercoris]
MFGVRFWLDEKGEVSTNRGEARIQGSSTRIELIGGNEPHDPSP